MILYVLVQPEKGVSVARVNNLQMSTRLASFQFQELKGRSNTAALRSRVRFCLRFVMEQGVSAENVRLGQRRGEGLHDFLQKLKEKEEQEEKKNGKKNGQQEDEIRTEENKPSLADKLLEALEKKDALEVWEFRFQCKARSRKNQDEDIVKASLDNARILEKIASREHHYSRDEYKSAINAFEKFAVDIIEGTTSKENYDVKIMDIEGNGCLLTGEPNNFIQSVSLLKIAADKGRKRVCSFSDINFWSVFRFLS